MLTVHWRLAILEMVESGAGKAARSNARLIGPKMEFDVMGVVITFTLSVIYTMGNIGVMFYYRKEKLWEFNFILHIVFPVTGIIVLFLVVYNSLIPWPEAPIGYAFWVVLTWLILGIFVLLIMKWTGKEGWAKKRRIINRC